MTSLRTSGVDWIAARVYRIALALPLLILTCLFVGALVGPSKAQDSISPAETLAACGTDLRSTLSDAQKREIADEADDTIAGEGLFWKIEKDGIAPSYLIGTMHLPDPRITTLSAPIANALDNADRTILELAEIADPAAMAGALLSMPNVMTLPGDRTLKTLLDAEQYERVATGLEKKGIPIVSMNKMQPWFISMSMAMPDCSALAMDDPTAALDGTLASRASEAGQEVFGLETVEEQLSVLASLPLETQIDQLVSTMDYIGEVNDMMETMIGLYEDETIAAIMPTLKALYPEAQAVVGGSASFAAFEEALVDKRNALMVERSIPFLEEGNSFIGVGALHLIGETGVVNGLRENGWTVTRVETGD